jgi:Zn-dependent protease with chaperone function
MQSHARSAAPPAAPAKPAAATAAPPEPVQPSEPVFVMESSALTPERLAQAFVGEFRPVRISPLYHAGLLVVAIVMLLLPLAYVGLIALAAYGVYDHAVHHLPTLSSGSLILYVAPLVARVLVVLLLLKPLFAPRRRMGEPLTVQPDQEPLLTQYVELVCRAMNAPVPRRIDVDATANAAASFRRGFLSFFGNDLVLTLGLPLVAAMDLRQLTGVLAHELGHFRQGLAMRLTYIIHRVNGWFARVVYERDAWDQWLAELPQKDGWGYAAMIVWTAQLFMALTRLILKALMYLALAVSSFMSRQMEFDADRCESQMAGSEVFASTSRTLVRLNVAWEIVADQLHTRWAERRLPDDLPAFVAANAERLPKKGEELVEKIMTDRKTHFFSTHPATPRRIEAAERAGDPGIFRLTLPAWAVFRDFPSVCRTVTYNHYRAVVGKEIFEAVLVPTAGVLAQQQAETASGEAFQRYFPGSMPGVRPIYPEVLEMEIKPPRDAKIAAQELREARLELESQLPDFEQTAERYMKAIDKLHEVRVARDLVGAGIKVRPGSLGVPKATSEALREAIRQAEAARESVALSLEPGLAAARRRLVCALRLLYVSGVDKRLPEAAAYRQRIPALLLTLAALRDCREPLRELRLDLRSLITLIMNARGQDRNELFFPRLRDCAERVQRHLGSVIGTLSATEYPYEHSRGVVSIAEVLRTGVPANADYPVELAQNAEATIDGMFRLYFRVLSELAAMAEKVETLLKLPPIKAPAKPDASKKKTKKKKAKDEPEEDDVLQPF